MVAINLNDPGALTLESVAALIASKDDSEHRQIRVMWNGDVILSDDVGTENLQGVKFRFESWGAGNGYCGAKAASDPKWVQEVYYDIEKSWREDDRGYIDF